MLECKSNTADATGNVKMNMSRGQPKVYVPASALKDTGLCGETTPDVPSSGATSLGVTGGLLVCAMVGWAAVLVA